MSLVFASGAWSLGDTVFETRDEALDAAVRGVAEKSRVMPGSWRFWIPASSADTDNGAITDATVREMAAQLNASKHPRPIDGGSDDAPTHEFGHRGDVPATGWVHRAVVADVDGVPMMFLECEVLASIAPLIEQGRIAFSSVHVEWPYLDAETDERGPAELVSLGLTNRPANTNLPPIKSVRNGRTFAHVVMRAVPVGVSKMAETKAAPPAADKPADEAAKAEPTMAEVMAKLDEALARIEALEGEKVALEAARDVLSSQLIEARAVPARDADAEAVADVDAAMREGRFGERQKVAMVAMRKASKAVFDATVKLMPVMGTRSTAPAEVKPATAHAEAASDGAEAELRMASEAYPPGEREAFIARQKARIAARKGR